jgi:hypothetical protein
LRQYVSAVTTRGMLAFNRQLFFGPNIESVTQRIIKLHSLTCVEGLTFSR